MRTLILSIIAVFVIGIGVAYAYSSAGYPETHYPPTNDTKLELLVMNSTEFKERTTGYNYTLAGIDYNWIPKANNYYDFGGARVTFLVWRFGNATTRGETFNLDSQMKIKSVFEYNADRPSGGYPSSTCEGMCVPWINPAKPLVEPKNIVESPLKQIKSGIPVQDVKCKEDFVLVIKTNGDPACVKPISVHKLVERGWILETKSVIVLTEGQSTPSLTVKKILNDSIIGLEYISAPVPIPNYNGTGVTLHYGDIVGKTCGERVLILILVQNNTATFLEENRVGACPN